MGSFLDSAKAILKGAADVVAWVAAHDKLVKAALALMVTFGMVAPETATSIRDVILGLFL